ncbi:MAG: hypothetical protein ACPL3C_10310 [Pyrobaculum sp.]
MAYSYYIGRAEILWLTLSEVGIFIVPVLVGAFAAIYVYYTVYCKGRCRKPNLPLIAGLASLSVLIGFFAETAALPDEMGFAVNKTHLSIDVGIFGAPRGAVYNLSECRLKWVEDGAKVRRVKGFGIPSLVMGRLYVEGVGEGVGFAKRPADWILVAECGGQRFILSAPGLSPAAVGG